MGRLLSLLHWWILAAWSGSPPWSPMRRTAWRTPPAAGNIRRTQVNEVKNDKKKKTGWAADDPSNSRSISLQECSRGPGAASRTMSGAWIGIAKDLQCKNFISFTLLMHACLCLKRELHSADGGRETETWFFSSSYRLRIDIPASWSPIPISSIFSSAREKMWLVMPIFDCSGVKWLMNMLPFFILIKNVMPVINNWHRCFLWSSNAISSITFYFFNPKYSRRLLDY